MAIKLFESNLANVSPELRPHYVSDVEHGYRLDCDLEIIVRGLKRALAVERDWNKELKANPGGMPDGLAALSVFGGKPNLANTKRVPDVRAGLLPWSGTPQSGNT
jgi:hypothetical protein